MLDKVKRIVAIKNELDELDGQMKALKAEYDKLEPEVIEYMSSEGIQNLAVDGRTVYVKRQLWASVNQGNPAALDILRDNGLSDFIEEKVNSNRISSFVREFEKNEEEIPGWCRDALNITEKYSVGMQKKG